MTDPQTTKTTGQPGETRSEALSRCSGNCQGNNPTIYEELIGLLQNLPDQDAQDILQRIRSGADAGSVLQQAKAGDVMLQMAVKPETRYRYEFPYRAEMPRDFHIDNPYMKSLIYEAASLYSYGDGPELTTPSGVTDLASEEQRSLYLKPFHAAQVVEPLLNDAKISRWTNVSKNDVLMRDLLRVMFRCEYQFTAAFHKDLFLQDLVAGRKDFCSSLLVNAILAYACACYPSMSNRVEYWNPNNLIYRFTAEAKRLWELESKVPRITNIQAGVVLTVFHNLCGVDEIGKPYRLQAIALAQQLGIFDTAVASRCERLQRGREYTAWALYNWESLSAFLFMFAPLIKEPPVWTLPDPSKDRYWYGETWVNYPLNHGLSPLDMGQVLQARCQFRIIMNEFCNAAYSEGSEIDLNLAHRFRGRLESWYRDLPESLTPKRIVLPGQLQIHLFYYHLLLTIFEPLLDVTNATSEASPHQIVASAKKNLNTLVRLYFLRHGFEAMDLFMVIPLMLIGYESISLINDDTPADEIESLRATLILVAQGLYYQRRNYYLAQVLFRVIRGKMRQQEIGLLESSMALKLGNVDRDTELTAAVRSQWPVINVKKQEEIEPHVLNNIIESFGDMDVEEET
ncbi:nitrogen assimilation transcription factor nit-4 [Fusarium sporotrichioides]|uniref:Nitrogen assimilation transcription factor nit-4 n=1 Tax=Fusarium sporotrichioides TaxID=5514 RepID=A0A395SF08_FUSSP|nr:nitrogen assimilation transcription factor nit-4 [Fusarium sporotrichioides]